MGISWRSVADSGQTGGKNQTALRASGRQRDGQVFQCDVCSSGSHKLYRNGPILVASESNFAVKTGRGRIELTLGTCCRFVDHRAVTPRVGLSTPRRRPACDEAASVADIISNTLYLGGWLP